jgi:hypothetical protein
LRNNIDDTFKADEDIIKEILELGEYRTACEVKEYLLQHDTLIWENREVMKKLVLGT